MNILTKRGSQDNVITYEHICDTIEDRQNIESKYITLGTVCIVLNGENGGMEVYMADSSKEWHDIMITGSDGESSASGLSIYVCAQNEVQNGKPAVSVPAENTLYLVPSGNESGNLYDEYIYVNDEWELFGGASIDLTNANIPEPEKDGMALVSVNGEWAQQPGYGFIEKGEEITLFSSYGSLEEQMPGSNIYVYSTTLNRMRQDQKIFIENIDKYFIKDKISYLNLYINEEIYTYTLIKDENRNNTHTIIYSDKENNIEEGYFPNGAVIFEITNTDSEYPTYTMSIVFSSLIEDTEIELFINEENIKQIDTKYIPILGDSCDDGVALISVDNKWVKQAGYGYVKEEDIFVLSELNSPNFEINNQEYSIHIPLTTQEQEDLWDEMFYDQSEFKIKINNTVYTEGFGMDYDQSTIFVNDNNDNGGQEICRLSFFPAALSSQGTPEILFTTSIKPDYIKIYNSTIEYSTIDSNLLPKPDINVDSSVGNFSVVMNEKEENVANGPYSTAQGIYTKAEGFASHAEGDAAYAIGHVSHAEGSLTLAYGEASHTEGIGDCVYYEITAHPDTYTYQLDNLGEDVQDGWVAYDENSKKAYVVSSRTNNTIVLIGGSEFNVGDTLAFYSSAAYGEASHAEGYNTAALSDYSHAEGKLTKVLYDVEAGHAEGYGTVADTPYLHVEGLFNAYDGHHDYIHVVGNGTDNDNRSNAYTLDLTGNAWYAGGITANESITLHDQQGDVTITADQLRSLLNLLEQ